VGLDDHVVWDAGFPVETINVLRKVFEEKGFFMQKRDEGVRYCWTVFAGVELVGECVEWKWVLAEKGNVKDCFCVG